MKITRLRTYDPDDSHYSHPNGWRIIRMERDWSMRGHRVASFDAGAGPKVWWDVWPLHVAPSSRRRGISSFAANTLREARAWCDEHDRFSP